MPRCYATQNPVYYPAMRLISAISQSNPLQVTTTFAHGYKTGLIVRLEIPVIDGMQQAHNLVGPITVTGETTFTMPFNSTKFQAFAIPISPGPHDQICAQVIPVGEENNVLNSATVNILP